MRDSNHLGNMRLSNKRRRGGRGSQSCLLSGAAVISQRRHNTLVTSLTRCLPFLSPTHSLALSYVTVLRALFWFPSFNHPTPQCADPLSLPRPRPHKEYVITGESAAWWMTVCVSPQFSPGRSYSTEAIIRLTVGSSPAHRASSTFPPGLRVPLSLYASLPLSVFVSPSGLPDVPGYMPLSSLVQGTKATTRKEVSWGSGGGAKMKA